jgi:hypothetical protein
MSSDKFDQAWDTPIWGAVGIGKVINRTKRQTYHLLEQRLIDADKVGAQYCSTRRRLLTPKSQRERRSDP